MIRYFFAAFVVLGSVHPLEAADFTIAPHIRSAVASASANQSFGKGPEKAEKTNAPDFSSFPQTLQARASDQMGNERSAKGEIHLEMDKGLVKIKGKLEATDSNPSDFLAPLASVKGVATIDLKVVLADPSKTVKAKFRVSGEGPSSFIGAKEGDPLPSNITLQVLLNEEMILAPEQISLGAEKSLPSALHHGDVLTFIFQSDFSIFSAGQADVSAMLSYTFSQ